MPPKTQAPILLDPKAIRERSRSRDDGPPKRSCIPYPTAVWHIDGEPKGLPPTFDPPGEYWFRVYGSQFPRLRLCGGLNLKKNTFFKTKGTYTNLDVSNMFLGQLRPLPAGQQLLPAEGSGAVVALAMRPRLRTAWHKNNIAHRCPLKQTCSNNDVCLTKLTVKLPINYYSNHLEY